MSTSRPLLSSDRNVHRLVAESRVAQGQEAGEWGGGKFLAAKLCPSGCSLLKDEMKQQSQEVQPGPQRRQTHPTNFPSGKPGIRTEWKS